MSDEQYGLFFGIRRSIRYHDRRVAFYTGMHHLTGVLTVLLAGSVLFDVARPGNNPSWLIILALLAAVLSAIDVVVGYAAKSGLHRDLKRDFNALEARIVLETDGDWDQYRVERLRIEQNEPPIYQALDLLCHNEVLRSDGAEGKYYVTMTWWQQMTRHIFHWADLRVN